MDARQRSLWTFGIVTAAAFLILQVHFALAWRTFYQPTGGEPPSFTTSSKSLLVGVSVLFILPTVTLWFRRGPRRQALLAMWVGAMIANLAVVAASQRLREGNLLGLGLILMSFVTAMPLVIGALAQAFSEEGLRYYRARSRSLHGPGADNRAI
jgi:hypothetical protein